MTDEILKGVGIALGHAATNACGSFTADGNDHVNVAALVKAVNNALTGCH